MHGEAQVEPYATRRYDGGNGWNTIRGEAIHMSKKLWHEKGRRGH